MKGSMPRGIMIIKKTRFIIIAPANKMIKNKKARGFFFRKLNVFFIESRTPFSSRTEDKIQ